MKLYKLLQKRHYRPFVNTQFEHKANLVVQGHTMFKFFIAPCLVCMAIFPAYVKAMTRSGERYDIEYKDFIGKTEKAVVRPAMKEKQLYENQPWYKRLDPSRDYDYEEIKLIVRAELEAQEDTERYKILNSDRPWKRKVELKLKNQLEKFGTYPNYYLPNVAAANTDEEN